MDAKKISAALIKIIASPMTNEKLFEALCLLQMLTPKEAPLAGQVRIVFF